MAVLEFYHYIFIIFFIIAGITHFTHKKYYVRIVPPILPFPMAIVLITGAMEIVLALLLLIEEYRIFIAWVVIIYLIAVYPANIYMFYNKDKFPNRKVTFGRLPFQFLFMYWAYLFI